MADVQAVLPGIHPTLRPQRSEPAILLRAAQMLAPAVLAWIDEPSARLDQIVSDLAQVIRPFNDGYALARRLDDVGYAANAELVEVLGEADRWASKAFEDAVKVWVVANGIVLDLPLGATVTTRRGDGVINGFLSATAQYVVAVTLEQRAMPGRGCVLNAEDVSVISLPFAAASSLEVPHG
ncbi:MAG: hypothetical protein P4L76_06410 [Beijerinckiaceae bacterium]|nr:hypothetical protein [Beijerinckiaceae bacterium]